MMFYVSPRDRTITRRVLAGESCRRVSRDYALCASRVRQITLQTVHRLWPYHPILGGLGLLRMRQVARPLLAVLAQEEERTA